MVVGRGSRVEFWKDVLIGVVPLMLAFLRIYALAKKKGAQFLSLGGGLMVFRIGRTVSDSVAWTFCPTGLFSVKSATRCLEEAGGVGIEVPITILTENLVIACTNTIQPKLAAVESWSAPLNDDLKFYVDGTTNGERCRVGIEGAFRNSKGEVLCSFYAFVRDQDATSAEMMAIHKAYCLCVVRGSLERRSIVFISDSREAVNWVNEEGFGNLNLLYLIYDIRLMLESLGNASVNYNPKSTNSLTDALAKRVLDSNEDYVVLGDR
ncbi:hypothetical protein Ddye_001634 [Dipteronia dyeriana]|uniref:RNase H type-1 domain-containing protein n=1 Tax=Dipteronia dyeriana TaxID=168575 RepID=A0AAD9XP93_9ROSI|nr:hypothetical protein Ddye_001634 [Dipteronia dyeriana]